MRSFQLRWIGVIVALLPASLAAQRPVVDDSAASRMYQVLESMQKGAPRDSISRMLDTVLASRAYQTMFRHYNRSWRPSHLPQDVFKRMILSLQFPEEYSAGENQRADQMLPVWRTFYGNLPRYAANLQQMAETDLTTLITLGVRDAYLWLPRGWKINASYLPIIPSGGSKAFTIDSAQGYDFFQLPRTAAGTIIWIELRSVLAHEMHHLGVHPTQPSTTNTRDSVALEFLSIFMPEGTATKFINNFPGGCVPAVDSTWQDPIYSAEARQWWGQYTKDEAELFARVAATFERARSGTLGRDSLRAEIGSYWLAGYISPVYFVGAELYGAIYHAFGKWSAFSAMEDVSKLLPMYDAAIKKRRDLLGHCPAFADSTIMHARAIVP